MSAPYEVFITRPGKDKEKPFWERIGVAFPHKDKQGLNVKLHALPLGGELVIRKTKAKGSKEPGSNG